MNTDKKIVVHSINPIPVLKIDLEENEFITPQEVDICKKVQTRLINHNVLISNSSQLIESEGLNRVGVILDNYVDFYAKNVLGVKQKFTRINSWLTINSEGSHHQVHNHPNSMIAVVLYFDELLSDNILSNLIIQVPGLNKSFETFKFLMNIETNTPFNFTSYHFFPKSNRIFIFPAHLNHKTDLSPGKIKRFCIGANYFMSGIIDSPSGLETIRLSVGVK